MVLNRMEGAITKMRNLTECGAGPAAYVCFRILDLVQTHVL